MPPSNKNKKEKRNPYQVGDKTEFGDAKCFLVLFLEVYSVAFDCESWEDGLLFWYGGDSAAKQELHINLAGWNTRDSPLWSCAGAWFITTNQSTFLTIPQHINKNKKSEKEKKKLLTDDTSAWDCMMTPLDTVHNDMTQKSTNNIFCSCNTHWN